MLAIYKREVRSYFNSMIGCVFAAFLTIIGGVYFMVYNLYSGYPFFAYSLVGVIFMLLISVPVLSMKSFAEDRKRAMQVGMNEHMAKPIQAEVLVDTLMKYKKEV